jgi:LysR family glycine cleavage system transcriptional activator
MKVDFTPMLSPKLAESIGGVKDPERPAEAAGSSMPAIPGGRCGSRPPACPIPARRSTAQPARCAVLRGKRRHCRPRRSHPDAGPSMARRSCRRAASNPSLVCNDGADYWLAYPEGRRNVPKIKAFRNWILDDITTRTGQRRQLSTPFPAHRSNEAYPRSETGTDDSRHRRISSPCVIGSRRHGHG